MPNMFALSFSFYSPVGFGSNDLIFTQRKDISWAAFSKAQYEVQLQKMLLWESQHLVNGRPFSKGLQQSREIQWDTEVRSLRVRSKEGSTWLTWPFIHSETTSSESISLLHQLKFTSVHVQLFCSYHKGKILVHCPSLSL